MDVRLGYKQTEIGLIPDEWEALPASQVGRFRGGTGFPLVYQGKREGEFPFYKVSDMNNDGNETYMVSANNWVSEGERKSLGAHAFPAGAIVFAKVGAAVFLERKKILSRPSCIDNNMAAFIVAEDLANFLFVHVQLLGRKFGELVATTALPSLSGKVLGEIVLAIPPLPEQSAIATALSDVDALLSVQDALIAKKRAIKQGAMQALLTGKHRLPGFAGDWSATRLGGLGLIYGGLAGKSKQDFGQGAARYVPFVNVVANVVVDINALDKVDVCFGESQNLVLKGDLLFNGSSETPEEVALCALVADHVENLYLNSFCFGFRLKERACAHGLFLSYYMRSQVGRDLIKSLAQGSTRYNLSKSAFLDSLLMLPGADEQAAIATALSEMDAEIATLEAQRAKTAQLKHGMMQQLLTGRIRLI